MSVVTDYLRPVSPQRISSSYRRASLNVKSLSLDAAEETLSTSLPMSLSKDETLEDFKKSKQEAKKGLHSRSGTFSSSPHSPTQLSPFGYSRPRSASLCSPRKGFLGLPKSRQPSLKKTPKHSHSPSEDSNTCAIDATLVLIKNQLELLSEENQAIEERVNNLTSEITQILALREKNPLNKNGSIIFPESSPARRPCFKRTLSDEPCSRRSSRDGNFGNIILSDLKETCEESIIERSYEDNVMYLPLDLACKKFDEKSRKRDSLDSTGSSEPISRSSSNDVCVVIVTDMSDTFEGMHVEPIASQTSGSSQAEDDVFMSQ